MTARREVYALLVVIALLVLAIAKEVGATGPDVVAPTLLLWFIIILRMFRGER